MRFSEVIREIDMQLNLISHGKNFFKWCDEACYGRYEKVINTLDNAIASGRLSSHEVGVEIKKYRDSMIGLIKEYKQACSLSEADAFLEALQGNLSDAHKEAVKNTLEVFNVDPKEVKTERKGSPQHEIVPKKPNAALSFFAKLDE